MRDSAALATLIARVEKEVRGGDGMIKCSRAELSEAWEALQARKKALCEDRPLLCQECGRALSVAWAELDNPLERSEVKKCLA